MGHAKARCAGPGGERSAGDVCTAGMTDGQTVPAENRIQSQGSMQSLIKANKYQIEEQQMMDNMHDAYLDEILAHTACGRSEAERAMNDAVTAHHISEEEYVREQFYYLNSDELAKYFDSASVHANIDLIAKEFSAPKGLVYRRFLDVNSKYKIPLSYFERNGLYRDLSDENLSAHRKKRKESHEEEIQELMRITGWDRKKVNEYVRYIYSRFGVPLRRIISGQLFKMTDDEIAEQLAKNSASQQALVKDILDYTGWDEFQFAAHRLKCKTKYRLSNLVTYYNLDCYKLPDEVLDTFAVLRHSQILTKKYNTEGTSLLDDKTLFDKTYKDFLGRKFWINENTSLEEFRAFVDGLDEIFCKPINLHQGEGCFRFKVTDDVEGMYEHFMNGPLMLIEEIPVQHHLISEIYPHCIDTIRLITLLDEEGVFHCFGSWIKFGAGGSVVDGRIQGGSFAGVDEETGIVVTRAIDKDNVRHTVHPDTGKQILGFHIPYYKEALQLAERALRHVDSINYVGWDICITENGPIVIEGNARPALHEYQLLFNEQNYRGMKYKYERFL